MRTVRYLLAGLLASTLAACSSDAYPDMHLEPRTAVSLRMDPARVTYASLSDDAAAGSLARRRYPIRLNRRTR
jgi:hypothetical protein